MLRLFIDLIGIVVILSIVALCANYIIFFWINKIREWRKENEALNKAKQKEALEELERTHNLLEQTKDGYITVESKKEKLVV